jgi:Winged helix-turn helix
MKCMRRLKEYWRRVLSLIRTPYWPKNGPLTPNVRTSLSIHASPMVTPLSGILALAAVYDGMDRETAARIGGMDRQTLRDWAHRFNEEGPAGLINVKPIGRRPKLSVEQQEALRQLVEAGPDPEKHGVVRWRCLELAACPWSAVRCRSVDSRDRPPTQAAWLLAYQCPPVAPSTGCAGDCGF